ncbi:MAG TPA: TonB-dependent receptor [Terriglobales bacterium]|nr:TonB-dependent receptor [Terriglobales bacterium]
MRKGFRRAPKLVWGLVVVVSLCGLLIAQTQFGTISGKVTDANDAVIQGAKVTITNLGTRTTDVTQTNDDGLFAVGAVPTGEYEIAVEKEGFRRSVRKVKMEVAQRVGVPFVLEVGAVSETVEVTAQAVTVNTVSGDISREITASELENLPLLTRNPYALVALAPGAVNTDVANGDNGGGNSPISVAGARNRSVNFLLDGSENNETFSTGPSTIVPVDAIQEFKVQANNMTAEFGRNTVQANVVTKSGTNSLHGSAYEYYRGSALSSTPVEEKVNGIPKGRYVRNVFGGALGGPIVKDKTFFFGALEATRVRSQGRNFYYVPTQEFFDNASINMQDYLTAGGGLPTPLLPGQCLTANDILTAEGSAGPLVNSQTGAPIPGTTNLFCRTFTTVPTDAGGETGQNTWSIVGKVDHHFSPNTTLSGRYAWYRQLFPVGAGSDSPYSDFNTDASFRSQNGTLTLTHAFNERLFSESRVSYSRTEPQAPLGAAPVTIPCFQYAFSGSLGTGDQMVFPGYLPAFCSGFAIPSGGPQNTYSAYTGFTFTKGRHIFKWGGYARHLRDNHTFGAFANANGVGTSMQNMLGGIADGLFSVGIDPRGHVPGELYDVAVDGPIVAPSFTRHFHYNEVALYAEDQLKLHPRFTLTLGMRWEYLGVLHSPGAEKILDANLYLNAVGVANPGSKSLFEQIRDARFQRGQNFFNQDWNNFGPRLGFAWDMFGKGRTVLRGGYGMFFDANFGNALFNAIQNPPNYAVIQFFGAPSVPIGPNQYDSLAQAFGGGGSFLISSSARMLNKDMETAYSQQWNLTLEHDVLGKGIIASVGYIGAKGDKLYSLNNLNQRGSCIMLGDPACGTLTRLNTTGLTGMNRRANESFSRYHALSAELKTREIGRTGLQLNSAYTWAHSIDNATSFFNDSAFDGNGNFGFHDPYNPSFDRASSSNDIRHRFTISYSWNIPWTRNLTGIAGQILGGWTLTGIYQAQTGAAFSVYEDNFSAFGDQCSRSGANACYPILVGALPSQDGSTAALDSLGNPIPNRYNLYDFRGADGVAGTADDPLLSLFDFCGGDLLCSQQLYFLGQPGPFLPRNTFRGPGYWNMDFAVLKDFKLPREGMKLQFRAEFFNLPNHSNLFADPNTNLLSSGQVLARRGVPPGHELSGTVNERRNIQLALRFQW